MFALNVSCAILDDARHVQIYRTKLCLPVVAPIPAGMLWNSARLFFLVHSKMSRTNQSGQTQTGRRGSSVFPVASRRSKCWTGPFPSCLLPLSQNESQNESSFKTIHMKMYLPRLQNICSPAFIAISTLAPDLSFKYCPRRSGSQKNSTVLEPSVSYRFISVKKIKLIYI